MSKEIGICGMCKKEKKVEHKRIRIKAINKIALSRDTYCDDCFTTQIRAKIE